MDGELAMKDILTKRTTRAGIAAAASVGFAVIGIGAAQAAQFQSAGINIEARGEAQGGITCTWRETGLTPSTVVYYACTGGAVAVLYACTYKGRVIYQSPTRTDVFANVVGEHGTVPFLAQKNGQINASTTTPIPEIEVPEGQELCTAPSEQAVVAVRWCNASLSDTTNNLVATTVPELFQRFIAGVGEVPACASL
jgi:hypothetical protein